MKKSMILPIGSDQKMNNKNRNAGASIFSTLFGLLHQLVKLLNVPRRDEDLDFSLSSVLPL